MIADFLSSGNNGQSPLLNITKVSNGWIVVVHHFNRDKEVSPETQAKRQAEEKARIEATKEREKQRIVRDMKLQLANMAIIGEAAGKAQHKGIEDSIESWKTEEEEEESSEEDNYSKIENIANKIAEETMNTGSNLAFLPFSSPSFEKTVETLIFTDRQKMIEFVTSMLQPVLE